MLEVKPNKEILKIKSTMFLGFTAWQMGWFISGVVVASAFYYLFPLPSYVKGELIIPIVFFSTCVGFMNVDGMNLFQIIKVLFETSKHNIKPLTLEDGKENLINYVNDEDRETRYDEG